MRTLLSKSIAILLGVILFAGGASTALAGDPATAQQPATAATTGPYNPNNTYWAFKWRISQGFIPWVINSVGGAGAQPGNYSTSLTQAGCEADSARVAQSETILSPCAQYTGAQLNTLTQQATTANAAYNQTLDSSVFNQNNVDNPYNLKCWLGLNEGFDVGGCVATVAYFLYIPTALLVTAGGKIFDAVMVLSIDSAWVNQGFIDTAWTVLRDFANMAFIFVLLYAGIMTMFGKIDWKRTVIQVVVVALFINFSLFATKIIIDAGNILAVGIYSQIGSTQQNTFPCPPNRTCIQERNTSASLAGAVQLQNILSPQTANSLDGKGPLVFVFLAGIILNLSLFWIFFRISFVFAARLVQFWYLMITSPAAFLSTAIPGTSGFATAWFGDLIKQTFLAPVFLFAVYILLMIVNSGILNPVINPQAIAAQGYLGIIIKVALVSIILFVALSKALGIAEKMSGEAGATAKKYLGGALGLGVGYTLGKIGKMEQKLRGGRADREYESGKWQKLAQEGTEKQKAQARRKLQLLDEKRKMSYDIREQKWATGALGALGLSQLGKAEGVGGYKKYHEEEVKKATTAALEYAKMSEVEKQKIKEEEASKVASVQATVDEQERISAAAKVAAENSPEAKRTAAAEIDEAAKKIAAETAKTKAEEARRAYDATRNAGKPDPALSKALADAEKEEADAMNALKAAEGETIAASESLANASVTKAAQGAAVALQSAREQLVKQKAIADSAIEQETARRGAVAAENIVSSGVASGLVSTPQSGFSGRLSRWTSLSRLGQKNLSDIAGSAAAKAAAEKIIKETKVKTADEKAQEKLEQTILKKLKEEMKTEEKNKEPEHKPETTH